MVNPFGWGIEIAWRFLPTNAKPPVPEGSRSRKLLESEGQARPIDFGTVL